MERNLSLEVMHEQLDLLAEVDALRLDVDLHLSIIDSRAEIL